MSGKLRRQTFRFAPIAVPGIILELQRQLVLPAARGNLATLLRPRRNQLAPPAKLEGTTTTPDPPPNRIARNVHLAHSSNFSSGPRLPRLPLFHWPDPLQILKHAIPAWQALTQPQSVPPRSQTVETASGPQKRAPPARSVSLVKSPIQKKTGYETCPPSPQLQRLLVQVIARRAIPMKLLPPTRQTAPRAILDLSP